MIKTFPGTSINYGAVLPPSGSQADGTLFFKTNFDSDGITNPPGLYLYGFKFDVSSQIVGEQVGQGWTITSDSGNFFRKTGDIVTGNVTFTGASPHISLSSGSPGIRFTETDQGVGSKEWLLVADGGNFQLQTRDDSFGSTATVFYVNRAGVGTLNSQIIWTAGNDGAGSTMDADLLDGQHGSYYSNLANSSGSLDINSRTSGALAVSRGGTNNTTVVQGGILYGGSPTQLAYTSVGSPGQLLQSNGTGQPSWVNASSVSSSSAASLSTPRQISLIGNATGSTTFDGSANVSINVSVLNSAQLTGLSPSSASTGNTIAQRDPSGYLYASYLNQSSGNNENPTISQVMVTNGADNFLRKASISSLASAIASSGALTGYVSKLGDTMSGSLTVGDGVGDRFIVNGVSINWNGSSINAAGPISASVFNGSGSGLTGTASSLTAGNTTSISSAVGTSYNWTAVQDFISTGSVGSVGRAGVLEAMGLGGNPATMSFHRSGAYAVNIGLDTDNVFRIGGWSDGTNVYRIQIDTVGNLTARGDVVAFSDERVKKNIRTIENAVSKVQSLRGVDFDRLDGTPSTGVIAQEIQKVIPSVVHETADGTLGVAYGNLVGVLIEAIKEQQAQIEELNRRINTLID